LARFGVFGGVGIRKMEKQPTIPREVARFPDQEHCHGDLSRRREFLRNSWQMGVFAPAAMAGLAGCQAASQRSGESKSGDRQLSISFVGAVMNNPFWGQIQKGATSAGNDLDGVDVTYMAPENFSHANVNEIIRSAISAKPDGVAIDYRGRMFEEVTQNALDQGAAVQFYNNFKGKDSTDPRVVRLASTAVGLDKYQAALRSAEDFLQLVSPGQRIVLFNGGPDSPEHLEIQQAYLKVLADAGWKRAKIEVFPVTLDPAENYQLMKTYLAAHADTAGIICWDSVTGGAAARAKADAGLDIPAMAWNLDSTIIRSIKEGTLNLTLTQQPFLQGYYAVVALYLKIKYGFIDPPLVDPATLIVDRANIEQVEALYNSGIAG
jgi:simple sugar transport system substrate-binding protein